MLQTDSWRWWSPTCCRQTAGAGGRQRAADRLLALVVANVLQTANFALNFVLYCACNSQFRATWTHLFTAAARKTFIVHVSCIISVSDRHQVMIA